jgi:hypothetical protein
MEQEIRKLTRREMVEKLLGGMAAGIAWPLIPASHPIYQHVKDGTTLGRADAAQHAVDWKPLFLNTQQNETIVALSESIVPGSAKAQVNRFIDLLLSVDSTENQQKFTASLAAFETEAQSRFGRGFPQLASNQRDELLTHLSAEGTHKKHFDDVKEWVTIAYYSSEDGMRELGWTATRTFRVFPACEQS